MDFKGMIRIRWQLILCCINRSSYSKTMVKKSKIIKTIFSKWRENEIILDKAHKTCPEILLNKKT